MKRTYLLLALLSLCCPLHVLAQSMNLFRDGKIIGSYDLNEIDSITFDQRANMWAQANVNLSYYYAPGWQQTAAPKTTESEGTYTIPLTVATSAQWQAQVFFITDIATDAHKRYDFSLSLKASKKVTNATVKLYQDGQDNCFYFSDQITLNAGEEVVFRKEGMDGIDMSKVALVLDFGGNAAATTITAGRMSLKESDYDTSAERTCPLDGYELIWSDEFSGINVSTSRWTYQTANPGWVNNELQTYVAGRTPRGQKVTEVSNGTLKIRAIKEGSAIYSARMYGRQSIGFKYGYFEARIKLPQGKGTWPAWWMMPVKFNSWPADGEIDIMEEVGVDPNIVSSSIHCTAYNHPNNTQKTHSMTCTAAEQSFHVYALEWTADYIRTYVDGKEQLYFPNDKKGNKDTWPFDAAFYPILNLAWGGDWGGYNGVDESALPATMEVDYVRIWRKTDQ